MGCLPFTLYGKMRM